MRCLTLANELSLHGISIIWALREWDAQSVAWSKNITDPILWIPKHTSTADEIQLLDSLTQSDKLTHCITDLSHIHMSKDKDVYENYLQKIKALGLILISFDEIKDFALSESVSHPAHALIIPYWGFKIKNIVKPISKYVYAGPRYMILRREFMDLKVATDKIITDNISNIVITMGGTDPLGLSLKALRSCQQVFKSNETVHIIIGPGFSSELKLSIKAWVRQSSLSIQVHINIEAFAELLCNSDLVITSGGLTRYESAYVGTPCIIISMNEFQSDINNEFIDANTSWHIPHTEQDHIELIADQVSTLAKSQKARLAMSKAGRLLIDGLGLERIVSIVLEKEELRV
jgi:UDP-2,4-diacetamido-2,4,6-trideoxy-beta-L-altropyranose hydrolase